ncbi:hypothetical protein BU26DRAFT_521023 [Trematosphaeria pertusa]|uniref:Carbohydrate-binding module family 18 protein n=1 Tax=Trematosphaeria pertusa TaxID=390896 RepID=A0A6A6I8M7_9PLEO|nr:uncharacterized protein BU26DRAFT_521023 [Trematosphaeria pertusa]KAF2246569.1 hypothetical protein BU26DRAFT_521023 [Trematosphaeria pertusa]
MKLIASLSIVLVAGLANVVNAAIICGTCAFSGTYCDAGGSYHLCYGQAGCGGATACPGGCYWDPDNPEYNGQAQC